VLQRVFVWGRIRAWKRAVQKQKGWIYKMTNIQKWFMIVGMWAVILFSIFAFYWVLVRPARVRQMCAQKAKQVCEETKVGLSGMMEINRAIYSDCLRANGVDK
jgi:hypothetical protein